MFVNLVFGYLNDLVATNISELLIQNHNIYSYNTKREEGLHLPKIKRKLGKMDMDLCNITNSLLIYSLIVNCLLIITNCLLIITNCQLIITKCLLIYLLIAIFQLYLLIENYKLPTNYYNLPTNLLTKYCF